MTNIICQITHFIKDKLLISQVCEMNYSIARDENFEISIHTYYSQATIFVRPNLVESSRYIYVVKTSELPGVHLVHLSEFRAQSAPRIFVLNKAPYMIDNQIQKRKKDHPADMAQSFGGAKTIHHQQSQKRIFFYKHSSSLT